LFILKKVLAPVTVVFILLAAMCVANAEDFGSYGIVNASLLNIRQAATTGSAIMGQIPNGQYVGLKETGQEYRITVRKDMFLWIIFMW